MKRILISAMESGAGKTVLACSLMKAFEMRGYTVQAFKCGPDYIDPMFHSRVLKKKVYNLDPFLQGENGPHRLLAAQKADIVLIEGAMGYFDGMGMSERASAFELACRENLPVLLVVRPQGSSLTLAASIRGLKEFRRPNRIAALFLSRCSPSVYERLKALLEKETGIPVVGYLPVMEEARLESRHLGLVTAMEVEALEQRILRVAGELEKTTDFHRLLQRMDQDGGESTEGNSLTDNQREDESSSLLPRPVCRIAVARDEAFCFYYERSLERLRECGAELIFFSPLHERQLPCADGLYLGGGYPELHAQQLSANRTMLQSVRRAVTDGLPTIAECGGFLYLQQSLEDETGRPWEMAGVLPGKGQKTSRLVRFGYSRLEASGDSLLFRKGERVPVHEFHYWESTECGTDLVSRKEDGRSWPCTFAGDTMYAGFPHLYLDGEVPLAKRFVRAAEKHRRCGHIFHQASGTRALVK